MVEVALRAGATIAAGGFGAVLGACLFRIRASWRRRQAARRSLGLGSAGSSMVGPLHVKGIDAFVLSMAASYSLPEAATFPLLRAGMWRLGIGGLDARLAHAGLKGAVTADGVAAARAVLCLCLAAAGFLGGALLSSVMAVLCGLAGALAGYALPGRAMGHEAQERRNAMERQLSQMAEVVLLGLRGGLSFDHALGFYCERFEGGLPEALSLARTKWTFGLASRAEALSEVADSYDSALLARVMGGVVRSLRYGTSLSAGLAAAAAESRSARKADLEERIAKAPVKMLVPVGTLILPAMLILVLGPVVLDLMEGF